MKVAILDHGLGVELAITFARAGYETGYYAEYRNAFPNGQQEAVGTGFKGVNRLDNLADALDWGDVIVCPDTHSQHFVKLAQKYGKPWFGAGEAEDLEADRGYLKKLLKRLKLPVGDYVEITGTEGLESYLRTKKGVYVKGESRFRGAVETFYHEDWDTTRNTNWGVLLRLLGANSQEAKFIVEQPIKSEVECAIDTIVVNGEYLTSFGGFEAKDSAHIGTFFDKVPEGLQKINSALAPVFADYDSRIFFSNESFFGEDGRVFLTDPCVRAGWPVCSTQLEMFANLPEVIIDAAHGKATKVKPAGKYVAALELKSNNLEDEWVHVAFPEKYRRLIKFQNCKQKDGKIWVVPRSFLAAMVVSVADDLDEAIESVEEIAGEIKCNGLSYDLNSLHKLRDKTIPAGNKAGIDF